MNHFDKTFLLSKFKRLRIQTMLSSARTISALKIQTISIENQSTRDWKKNQSEGVMYFSIKFQAKFMSNDWLRIINLDKV